MIKRLFGWMVGRSVPVNGDFMESLPSVGLGKPLGQGEPFQGKERAFYQFYLKILGAQAASEILSRHGFERSALFGLHAAAVRVTVVPRIQLMALASGDRELMGFAFQPPTQCTSWMIPGEHYKAEQALGGAIGEPICE